MGGRKVAEGQVEKGGGRSKEFMKVFGVGGGNKLKKSDGQSHERPTPRGFVVRFEEEGRKVDLPLWGGKKRKGLERGKENDREGARGGGRQAFCGADTGSASGGGERRDCEHAGTNNRRGKWLQRPKEATVQGLKRLFHQRERRERRGSGGRVLG